jgi:hypothetical protein
VCFQEANTADVYRYSDPYLVESYSQNGFFRKIDNSIQVVRLVPSFGSQFERD